MARSIQSPGVEIIEKDLSLSPVLPTGTNIFMTGFAPKGPTDEVLRITSVEEFEQVYGIPTNASERYFYYGASQILGSSTGNLYVSRMPYGLSGGEGYGSTYGALVYPVVAVKETSTVVYRNVTTISSDYFQDTGILDKLAEDADLDLRTIEFSTSGLSAYDKFSVAQFAKIEAAFTEYYVSNQSSPSLSAFAAKTLAQINNFLSGYDTEVSQNLNETQCTYVLGAPKFFELTTQQYYGVLDGSAFSNSNSTWATSSKATANILSPADFGYAGLVVVNKIQSTINNRWEGHYIGISDNTSLEPNSDYNAVRKIYTNNDTATGVGLTQSQMTEIPSVKLSFPLSATTDSGNNRSSSSISEALEKVSYSFPDVATSKFDDTVSFALFKLRTSPYNPDPTKLDFAFEEAKTGSIDYYRQVNNQNGGIAQSFFLENIISNSPNMVVFINENISNKNTGPAIDETTGAPKKKIRILSKNLENTLISTLESNYSKFGVHLNDIPVISNYIGYSDALFPLGSYSSFTTSGKKLGSVTYKLDRTLRKIENDEQFALDLVVEAGLGTIYATAKANKTDYYDDTQVSAGLQEGLKALISNDTARTADDDHNIRDNYAAIFGIFDNFCSKLRKDCMFIADPVRQVFVTGTNNLTLSDPSKSFGQYIYNPLKHLYETANSSYCATYGNWVKINDKFSGSNIWVPFSPFAAATMAEVDRNFEPWFAPAGFTRGVVSSLALALAITPKQKERDMLYGISVNPVAFFPNEGFNIFGQKTLLRQPSAFDRINVRRLFLYLEKATKRTVKFFVFEPNTLFTRNRVLTTLTPIFDRAKNTQGLYDYQLVCDKRNNTPAVIDQNELVVDIYLKPVRTAEFILVNFYATSTGANFTEFTGQ
jgi:hypothetical protein